MRKIIGFRWHVYDREKEREREGERDREIHRQTDRQTEREREMSRSNVMGKTTGCRSFT